MLSRVERATRGADRRIEEARDAVVKAGGPHGIDATDPGLRALYRAIDSQFLAIQALLELIRALVNETRRTQEGEDR